MGRTWWLRTYEARGGGALRQGRGRRHGARARMAKKDGRQTCSIGVAWPREALAWLAREADVGEERRPGRREMVPTVSGRRRGAQVVGVSEQEGGGVSRTMAAACLQGRGEGERRAVQWRSRRRLARPEMEQGGNGEGGRRRLCARAERARGKARGSGAGGRDERRFKVGAGES
jgi:hypothetical protein